MDPHGILNPGKLVPEEGVATPPARSGRATEAAPGAVDEATTPSLDEVSLIARFDARWRGGDVEEWLRARGFTAGALPPAFHALALAEWLRQPEAGRGSAWDLAVSVEGRFADGTSVRTRPAPRGAVGPDLPRLLLTSDAATFTVDRVALRVRPRPERTLEASFDFDEPSTALRAARRVLALSPAPSRIRVAGRTLSMTVEGRADLVDAIAGRAARRIAEEGGTPRAEPAPASGASDVYLCDPLGPESRGVVGTPAAAAGGGGR
jgi:alkyldihydroxyacetonephosphate synthase